MARILLVNDEPDLMEACSMVLESDGHSVTVAIGGEEGLELARALHPDVIIVDWVMPGMSGDEVFIQLRQGETEDIPIVMISALADAKSRTMTLGADAFLQKPFHPDDLLDAVSAMLKGAAERRASGWSKAPPRPNHGH